MIYTLYSYNGLSVIAIVLHHKVLFETQQKLYSCLMNGLGKLLLPYFSFPFGLPVPYHNNNMDTTCNAEGFNFGHCRACSDDEVCFVKEGGFSFGTI